MSFGSAISYILGNIGKVFGVFSGLSYLKTGGINQSINVVKANGTHFDMRKAQDAIYSGWSIGFWLAAISSILNFVLTTIFDEFTVGGLIVTIVSLAASLCVLAFFITLGRKNESHWKGWLVKVLIICGMISVVASVLSVVGTLFTSVFGLIGALIGGAAYGSVLGGIGIGAGLSVALNIILSCVVTVATSLLQALNMLVVLQGMNCAVPVNGGQMGYNANGYNPNGQMNPNGYNPNGYNPNANGYNPNNYNPNMSAGLSGLGAVNGGNQNNINIDKSQNEVNQNMNQGFNGFNGYNQNNFNQNNNNQNNYNQQNPNQNVNPQNVQMYACPYCGKAVMHGANPCPHCNNSLNWG